MRVGAAFVMCGCMGVTLAMNAQVLAAGWPQEEAGRNAIGPHSDGQGEALLKMPAKTIYFPSLHIQDPGDLSEAPRAASRRTFTGLAGDFVHDQADIWTSPARLRFTDAEWLAPLAGMTAGLLVTDRQVSAHISQNPTRQQHYRTLATGGVAALAGVGGGMVLWSAISHDEHQRETGFLSGEAAVNSFVVTEVLKVATQRERPYQGSGAGNFWSGGSSFPSEHAAAAWSIAGIIAHEYPGTFPKILAYGLATAVSISRIQSRDHFPSDVLVGSAIGWLVSQHVYATRHDPELGGSEWNSWSAITRTLQTSGPQNLGSPYVPLDSWIYPALDRLAGLGFVDSGFAGMRPWTRRECARLVVEAADKLADPYDSPQAWGLVAELQREFRPEMDETNGERGGTLRLESAYSRTEHISGLPINDGYHFAQTQINDFGRPFGEGWNTINGGSAYATAGAWVAYVRGEWQTAPAVPAFSLAARQAIQQVDFLPELPPAGHASVNRFELLDAYVGLTLSNWEFSFGKQSLWWGPGQGGPLMFSDNPPPLNMFRINRVSPFKLPWIFKWLGPMRVEFFLGQYSGQFFENSSHGFIGTFQQPLNPQPYVHGEQISFKPTPNFEFAVSRNDIFGGPTIPFTLGEFGRAMFSIGSSYVTGSRTDPGDEQSALNWSYRLPKLRNWLTFYGDAFADDQYSPIAYWDRSAIHAGLYLSHVPNIPKLDLRAEGVYTDVPAGGALSHGFFYFSTLIPNGQASDGYLLGSWIGREGQGAQAWTNYWFDARNRLQLNFRHQKVSNQFIPNGGSLTDFGARGDYWVRPNIGLSAWVQYERWLFPVIRPNASTNVTAGVQILFEPRKVLPLGGQKATEVDPQVGGPL
jgi:membrane-associated phospholipid phosphatase